MSPNSRRLRVRRRPPLRLLEQGLMGSAPRRPLVFAAASNERPITLMRLGDQDLVPGMRAIEAGARPSAVITGLGERPELLRHARRLTSEARVPWFADPLLFKTALPGYRVA